MDIRRDFQVELSFQKAYPENNAGNCGTGYVKHFEKKYAVEKIHVGWAIVISSMIWGGMHGIIRAVMFDYPTVKSLINIVSEFGGGIVIGMVLIFLARKGKSLWIAILFHAILDYLKL